MSKTKESQEFNEFIAHFAPTISQELCDYVRDVVLLKSRYIFTTRERGLQYGYCTHCKTKSRTKLKHNQEAVCTNCQSVCIVKASGVGRKYLTDAAYVVVYEKSVINPKAMVARGLIVRRDYRDDYINVETQFRTEALYLFEMGNSKMYRSAPWRKEGWYKENTVQSDFYKINYRSHCPEHFLKKALKGTPYEYSTWETYREGDNVKFFALFSRYPCIEYLTKLKMKYFVTAKLYGQKTYGAINWNGKRVDQVLKLEKQRVKEFLGFVDEPRANPLTLRLYQIACKEKSSLTLGELNTMADKYDDCFEYFKKMLKYATIRQAHGYISRQTAQEKKARRPSSVRDILITWKDYLHDCELLGMDLTDVSVLFPSKLYRAHQNTIEQVKVKEDEELSRKIQLRKEILEKYQFVDMGFLIRAARDSKELIEEGKALKHCVGNYAERYATGKCDILVIRKMEQPDEPYYTMEIQNGKIFQCRGFKNCDMTDEVKRFVDAFRKSRLEKKEKKTKKQKLQFTQTTERQGVAV
ncbi:PcfJ domain-containing protein [Brevibacillus centrosporus]|uniref:PcfJ domain-containing protein n=1 Tax=Brevibacillus centrosporus TaxID=54910 RepID=UPI003D1996B7